MTELTTLADDGIHNIKISTEALIEAGQREHIRVAGENSRDHGFHVDWPKPELSAVGGFPAASTEAHKTALRRAITEKLALVHEELSEALGEIRSGKDPLHIYYSYTEKVRDSKGKVIGESTSYHDEQAYSADGTPQYKPEGFLVELADANIRIHDLVYLLGGEDKYVKADRVKRSYNTTRPYKHGRKF